MPNTVVNHDIVIILQDSGCLKSGWVDFGGSEFATL